MSLPLVRLPCYALSSFIDVLVGINQLHHLPFVLLSFVFPVAIFAQQDRLLLSPQVDFSVRKLQGITCSVGEVPNTPVLQMPLHSGGWYAG